MIWSFVKIAVFILFAGALAFGATMIMETGGEVRIAFGGRELSLTPLAFVVAVILLFLAVLLLIRIAGLLIAVLRFVNGDETAISRYFDRNRENRGYEALQDSLVALATGDGRTAIAKATKAERLLERKGLTALVHAQAAEANGNVERAEEHYKTLLKQDKTRFAGVQGLLRQRLDQGDKDTALKLANKAFAIDPTHDGNLSTLFDLQVDAQDWSGSADTLRARVRTRAIPKDVGKRQESVLAVASGAQKEDENEAFEAAIRANRLAPGLVPAAVLAAELHTKRGELRKAASVTKKAWSISPHPDIAAAHAKIVPDETPDERIKRFKPLLNTHPDHPETRMLAAELNLAASDFPAARKALGDLADTDPTARNMAILAAISRGTGDDDATVSGYLARALSAPRGDAWICDRCNHIHGAWAPTCENCKGFDTLSWKRTPVNEDQRTIASAMLPLIMPAYAASANAEAEAQSDPAEGPVVEDAEVVEERA